MVEIAFFFVKQVLQRAIGGLRANFHIGRTDTIIWKGERAVCVNRPLPSLPQILISHVSYTVSINSSLDIFYNHNHICVVHCSFDDNEADNYY